MEIIAASPHVENIRQACPKDFNLRYNLRIIAAQVPELMPPCIVLDNAQVLTLGDQELRPSADAVAQRQIGVLQGLLTKSQTLFETEIEGGTRGSRVPGAADGDGYRVGFSLRSDCSCELRLESSGGDKRWLIDLTALSPAPAPRRLRLLDQAGRVWLETDTDMLPWQGWRDFLHENPGPMLDALILEAVENEHE